MVDAASINAIGSAIGGIGGLAQTAMAAQAQSQQIEAMIRAAQAEALGVIKQGREASRVAIQNAYTALRDMSFLEETTTQNIAAIQREIDFSAARVAGTTVGAGFTLEGSPLLAMTEVYTEGARAVANQELTRKIGRQTFQFQADEHIRRAQQATFAAQEGAQALLDARAAGTGRAQLEALQTRIAAIKQAGSLISQVPTILEAGRNLFSPSS